MKMMLNGKFMNDSNEIVKVQKRKLMVCAKDALQAHEYALEYAGNFSFNDHCSEVMYWKDKFWDLHVKELEEKKKNKWRDVQAINKQELLEVYEVTVLRADYRFDAEYFVEEITAFGVCANADLFGSAEERIHLKKSFESQESKKALEKELSNLEKKRDMVVEREKESKNSKDEKKRKSFRI